jgi:hypothetical protein
MMPCRGLYPKLHIAYKLGYQEKLPVMFVSSWCIRLSSKEQELLTVHAAAEGLLVLEEVEAAVHASHSTAAAGTGLLAMP